MRWRSSVGTSAALLGVGLELRLQGGKLGKGRIRIGRFFALAALESRRPGGPLPIPFARRPVESLLGFVPAMMAVLPLCVWLFGRGALEEALVEAFSIRGLALLADSWEQHPPFPGDAGFAKSIRQYRADLIENYRAAAPPGPDIAACFRTHCRDFTQGKGDPMVLAVVGEMERNPLCVEDLGGLNRWPARSAVPVAEYLPLWEKSCAELGASAHLPAWLRTTLEPG